MSAELRELADGIYAWVHAVDDRFTCNVGVVVEDDALVLIDSSGLPSSYLSLDRELRRFGRRVRKIVLTHGHPDHVAGVAHFKPEEIVATAATAASLRSTPMIPMLQILHPSVSEELVGLVNPSPNKLLSAPCTEGRLEFEILKGHTGGDLVVNIPDAEVAFVGDLCFFGQAPLGIGADFEAWSESVARLASLPGRIIPGHGSPGTAVDAKLMGEYLQEVLDCARRNRPMRTGAWSTWFDPWHDRIHDACHLINVEQAREPKQTPETLLKLLHRAAPTA